MKNFYSAQDLQDAHTQLKLALEQKKSVQSTLGVGKTLVMLFFNSSLRTRLSTEIAAKKIGMNVICLDMSTAWPWELDKNAIMSGQSVEHIKDAARVISSYCDVVAIRAFPQLINREKDYSDDLVKTFMQFATVPVINLESSILHPLQSFADFLTIEEFKTKERPKIVLSWAPHIKALPHAVSNSFLDWATALQYEITITHPAGLELAPQFTKGHNIEHDQKKAFQNADFIYAKNWSGYHEYGSILEDRENWIINQEKMNQTNNAFFMHCLPIRRNVVASDTVLDSAKSLIYQQAENRLHAAQYILQKMVTNE